MLLDISIDYGVRSIVGDDLVKTWRYRLKAILPDNVLSAVLTFDTHIVMLFDGFGWSWVDWLRNFGSDERVSGRALGLLVVAKLGDAPPG